MKTIVALLILVCAATVGGAQQPTPSPARPAVKRSSYHQRVPKRPANASASAAAKPEPAVDYLIGDAKVDVTKDETVLRLAMAQHGSVFIELPANDGPRYIIPGDPEMATVDEKALERNKRAIVVRPGSLFVPPLPNRKARTPAATVTAQMRSGLVVTFLFYPVEDLAQNVHRCVLSYNRDEVIARRRAAGLPVNLDNNSTNSERRDSTGQSTAPTSISLDSTDETKVTETKPIVETGTKEKEAVKPKASPSPTPSVTTATEAAKGEADERLKTLARDALAKAIKKPKQFKKWTKPTHGLSLSIVTEVDPKNEVQLLIVAVRNISGGSVQLVAGNPDLLIEMLDDSGKAINLQSIKKVYVETSSTEGQIANGAIAYYAIAYAAPVLGAHQQIKILVSQTNAADEPASIALIAGR
jgi:hypothetical protein